MGWEKGEIDGKPAEVKETGKRVEAISNLKDDPKDHVVSNDGLNADYVRESGEVIVNEPKGK
jgi:hypothetical protein